MRVRREQGAFRNVQPRRKPLLGVTLVSVLALAFWLF